MSSDRDTFLARVRQALADGSRSGKSPALPARGGVGYQGAGPDPLTRFCQELGAAGALAYRVADARAARDTVLQLIRARAPGRVLLGMDGVVASLDLAPALRAEAIGVVRVEDRPTREELFSCDLGVSGVDHLIAETGSLVVLSRESQPRSASLLPPVHIAVAHRDQLLADLFDLFALDGLSGSLPAGMALITGPSKTGDIELRLVTGVHGPGEVHVVLIDPSAG